MIARTLSRALAAGSALAAATLTLTSPAAAQGRPSAAALSWYGTYTAQEMVERGQGALYAPVDYRLTVTNNGCRLRAQGVMTDYDIRCTARINGQSLIIGFQSFGDGSMRNQYDVAPYRRGEALFTLTRNGRALRTTWQGLSTNNELPSRQPRFRKTA